MATIWRRRADYGPTQQFARFVWQASIRAILYRSVRDAQPSWRPALLIPAGFAQAKPHAEP